jgi:hypothetical protein
MGVLQGLVSNGGYLYAAWKGEPDDDRIFYSRWNGQGKWMAAGTIPGNTSAGPALGVLNGSLYAAWKGEWSDPRLFFSKFDGSNWDPQVQISNVYSDTGPALCALGAKLVAAWKSVFDQNLYFATFDGTSWTAPSQIGGVASSVGPSLAAFNGKLYAVWKGEDSDQRLWFATYDGTTWSGQNQIPNVGTSVGASLATVGNKLYAVWKGQGSNENLWYADYDGTSWSGQTEIPGVGSSVGAAIAEFKGNLYAMCKGQDSDVSLYNAELNGSTWSAWSKDIPGNTGPDTYTTLLPAPTTGNANYLLANSKGGAVTGATVTIIIAEDIVPDSAENYSFQINCNSPSQASGAEPFIWQQYGFRIAADELFYFVNNWRQQDETSGNPLINWDSRSLANNGGVVPLANNRLPKGWQLTTTLANDKAGNVIGFAFSVAQPNGTVLHSPALTLQGIRPAVVTGNLAPILNYQAIMVGENGALTTDFSAGQGIFQCYAGNTLTVTANADETGEGSNVSYSPLPASYPNGEFYQQFGIGIVPV